MLSPRSLCLASLPVLVLGQYQFRKEYSGSTFFNGWEFYDNFDNLTHGDAIFVSQEVASSANLAYVNGVGNAIIKVDNTTQVQAGQKRNTVRIQTTEVYGVGSLWIADMTHVPYGCSVWGAWWSAAPNWPMSGEIDTFEGVNLVKTNQMALHTNPGCVIDKNATFTGVLNSTDCSFEFNNNQGCVILDPSTKSYGAGFAANGGGVFVTEFALKGISVWFFPRDIVPPYLNNITTSFNTSGLGIPTANFPSRQCDDTFFQPQHLTFDITLCGDFAGNPQIFAETCSGICYDDYVIGPPSNYDNAYFEVRKIQTFHDPRYPIAQVNGTANSSTTTPTSVHQQPPPTFLKGPSNDDISDIATLKGLITALLVTTVACVMVTLDLFIF